MPLDNPHDNVFNRPDTNAFVVLGVSSEATDSELREAYLSKIKEHPKDKDPDGFERVKKAWKKVREPIVKAMETLDYIDPDQTIAERCAIDSGTRQFAGPGPWLNVIKEED